MCEYYRILVLFVLIVQFHYLKGHCTDFPDTTCINIDNCETLRALVRKIDKTRDELNYLRKRGCGFEDLKPKICCPNYRPQCETPDGVTGQCIDIHNCSYFASMLKNNFLLQDTTYIARSRCYGPAAYSVCCIPAPPREPMEFTTPKPIDIVRDKCPAAALPPDPQSECCGQNDGFEKITGGAVPNIDQFTWLALIEYRKHSSNKIVTKCGGALISGKYVLTAAHCVDFRDRIHYTLTSVRLGEYNTDNPGSDCVKVNGGGEECTYGAVSIPVQESIIHPDYTGGPDVWSDIALLRLEQMATFNYFVRPICLPTANISASPSAHMLRMFVAGWGAINMTHNSSPVKQVVDLPLVDRSTCESNYSRLRRLWHKQICAGGELGKDSCSGDSGGPLMVLNKNHYEIVGIVSYGTRPCGLKLPGVYTHVYAFLDWIKTNMHE